MMAKDRFGSLTDINGNENLHHLWIRHSLVKKFQTPEHSHRKGSIGAGLIDAET
jgi:hypothetical protein